MGAIRILFLAALMCCCGVRPAAAQEAELTRVALVIANGAYQSVPSLENPTRDARRVAAALTEAGFQVDKRENLTQSGFGAALRDFKRRADAADVALIYFAGHGIELEEENFLIPVDARLADPADALVEAVSLGQMLRFVSGARRLRVIVLDACRDNPFALRLASPTRNIIRGLKPVENLPAGTLVAYSASSGQQALDGQGEVSPFAAAFAERVVEPGLEVSFVFRSIRDDVLAASGTRQQRPWLGMELGAQRIVFVPDRRVSDRAEEFAAFDAASRAWNSATWRAFLGRWPEGTYAVAARNALASLERGGNAPVGADPVAAAQRALDGLTAQEWSAAENAAIISTIIGASSRAAVERLSGSGDPRAQWILGIAYRDGLGGYAKDQERALRLLRASALAGEARAQSGLGYMLLFGLGVEKDEAEAVRLFRLSAAQNNAWGQANLGFATMNGLGGVEADEAAAKRLFELAAAQGNGLGQANLGVLHASGRAELVPDLAEAVRLFRLAAAQGNAGGQGNLGGLLLEGVGVDRDEAEALRLLRLSAAQNNAVGQVNLGRMHAEGRGGLAANNVEGVRLYRLAAAQGNAAAQFFLGQMNEDGKGGLTANRAEAVRLYRLAARQEIGLAQRALERLGETW